LIEFTAPQTPQETCKVEKALAIIWKTARDMLNRAGFDEEHCNGL
jgi:hypothetical protein